MGPVLGGLLPLAVGVAISPVPIIATILMLLAPRAGRTSAGFLLGWVGGIVVVTTIFTLLASAVGLGPSEGSASGISWVRLLVGLSLVALSVRQWRSRPPNGDTGALPTWMTSIEQFTFGKAAGLAFLLAAVNPKNLLLCAAAGTAIGSGSLTGGQRVVAVVLYTVVAACTVAGPVVAYAFAAPRMRAPLDDLKGWLQDNNTTVMAVLLLVFGVVLTGQGLGAL